MDITSIIKSLDISSIKVFFLRILGGSSAVYDYIVGKALNAVNAAIEAHGEQVQTVLDKMRTISLFLSKYERFLPAAWVPYAHRLNDRFMLVYGALIDGRIERKEADDIINDFKITYADYMAD